MVGGEVVGRDTHAAHAKTTQNSPGAVSMVQYELVEVCLAGAIMLRDAAIAGPKVLPKALAKTKSAIPDVRSSML